MKVGIEPHHLGVEMVWEDPEAFYGHCVGPGWVPHLLSLTAKLEKLGWDGKLRQVKEKFGTLRFYWTNNIPGIMGEIAEDVVSHYEERTAYICEECGEFGELRYGGWTKCLCTKHNKERIARNKTDEPEQECGCRETFECEAHRA